MLPTLTVNASGVNRRVPKMNSQQLKWRCTTRLSKRSEGLFKNQINRKKLQISCWWHRNLNRWKQKCKKVLEDSRLSQEGRITATIFCQTKNSSLFFFSSLTSKVRIVRSPRTVFSKSGHHIFSKRYFGRTSAAASYVLVLLTFHKSAAENMWDKTSSCSVSEVLLPSFLGFDGVQDGLPLGLVALTDLLDLLLHLRVQRGQTQTELLHRPRTHLHTDIDFILICRIIHTNAIQSI